MYREDKDKVFVIGKDRLINEWFILRDRLWRELRGFLV